MKERPEIRKRTMENFVVAFWKLYEHKPLYKISIRELSDTAGYNRSTFYDYFSDIDALLAYAEDLLLVSLTECLEKTVQNNTAQETLKNAAVFFDRYGYYLGILFGPKGDPAFSEKYKTAIRPMIIEQLDIHADNSNIELISEYVLGAIVSSLLYWQKHQSYPAAELAAIIHTMMTSGIYALISGKPD